MSGNKRPYLVGVTGGSASGKTFLLNKLLQKYSREEITLVSQDNYYRSRDTLPRDEEGHLNFDHPDAVNLEALVHDLNQLCEGKSVTIKEYTFNNPNIAPRDLTYHPTPLILVEGLFVFYHPGLSRQLDLKIFVDADEHIKLSRRIKRDFAERGYGLDEVLFYYEKYVIPMYKKFILPYKDECDLILPNNYHMENAIAVIISHLDSILYGKKTR